jgi:hypothetical protein
MLPVTFSGTKYFDNPPSGFSRAVKALSTDINMNPNGSYVKISEEIIVAIHKR